LGAVPLTGWSLWEEWESDPASSSAAPGSAASVAVTVDFGSTFSHLATTVVTGQAWVTAASRIVAVPLAPAGKEMEVALLQLSPVVSSLVVGTGFTLTVLSPVRAKGTYTIHCVGV